MSNYAHPEVLVSTQWVADHLENPQVRFVEVVYGSSSPRFGMPAYESGHIPGAVAWNFEKDIQDSARKDLLDKDGLEALLSRSAIAPETIVVLYCGNSNLLAAFAFWVLKIYDHKNIRLLDGSRQKWMDEDRPTSSEVPQYEPTKYQAQEPNWGLRVNKDEVLEAIGKAGHLMVDTRPVEMYSGEDNAGTARGGHIPGAVNLPASRDTNPDGSPKGWLLPSTKPDGTFKSAEELRTMYDGLGIASDQQIITYCVGGGLSSHSWFVLTQLMGYPNVREYDRSWSEWGNLEDAPIEI